jgi:hypothetical protein
LLKPAYSINSRQSIDISAIPISQASASRSTAASFCTGIY